MTEPLNRAPDFDDAPAGRRLSLLNGVKVLDLTGSLAGPFASMVLGDLGAEIVKVEQITGDSTRHHPPYFLEGQSAYFLAVNRNKSSIALNIRSEGGGEILRRLIGESDVMLDNLRARQRESLGLDYETLERINPRIVSCSVTGFGSDGPYTDRPAYDIIVEALAGVMSLTGPIGGPSVRAGVPIGDITAGLFTAIGALSGLQSRNETGHGMHVDVAMLDCQISLLSYLAQYYFVGGLVARHQGREHVSIPTYNTFATADGTEIVIAANTQGMWEKLCTVLGRDDLAGEARFATNADRLAHRDELIAILQDEMGKWPIGDLHDALVHAGVPAAPINAVDAAFRDPQVLHREMVVRTPHPAGGDFASIGVPVKSEHAHGEEFGAPPTLGGQTQAILERLGYGEAEIEALQQAGAIGVGGASAVHTGEAR